MISVIVPAYHARHTIERCLRSLESQQNAGPFEVIVVDSSSDGTAAFVRAEFPRVRVVTAPARLWPGEARNLGVRQASGDVLAFTDADCAPGERWIAAIEHAHRGGADAVIGGAIANASTRRGIDWASYFCALSAWTPGTPPRRTAEIATGCLTMTRRAFDRIGPFLKDSYSSDTAFGWRAVAAGIVPIVDPSIVVSHASEGSVRGLLAHRFSRGRSFARLRARERHFSRWNKAVRVAAAPIVPFRLLARAMTRVRPNREYRRALLRVLPLVLLGFAAWSAGECAAYIERPVA